MLDGIGLCGTCRLLVNGKNKFACIDGPEFFGEEINFFEAKSRMKTYIDEEELQKMFEAGDENE